MSDTMTKLEKLTELQARDKKIRDDQDQLNKDINAFMSTEFGLNGPATLVDIVKKAMESTVEPSRIITP